MGIFDILGKTAALVGKGAGYILNESLKSATGVDIKADIDSRRENINAINSYGEFLELNKEKIVQEHGIQFYNAELGRFSKKNGKYVYNYMAGAGINVVDGAEQRLRNTDAYKNATDEKKDVFEKNVRKSKVEHNYSATKKAAEGYLKQLSNSHLLYLLNNCPNVPKELWCDADDELRRRKYR